MEANTIESYLSGTVPEASYITIYWCFMSPLVLIGTLILVSSGGSKDEINKSTYYTTIARTLH